MFRWSNMFGCSLAFALISLPEYFLTSRTASKKKKRANETISTILHVAFSFTVWFCYSILRRSQVECSSHLQDSFSDMSKCLQCNESIVWRFSSCQGVKLLSYYLRFRQRFREITWQTWCVHSPRKRTMSIMIIVRNTLFQNCAIQLQILSWKILCHLQHRQHKHVCNSMSPYSLTIQVYDHNPWPCCGHTNLLAEMKGKQRKMRISISA